MNLVLFLTEIEVTVYRWWQNFGQSVISTNELTLIIEFMCLHSCRLINSRKFHRFTSVPPPSLITCNRYWLTCIKENTQQALDEHMKTNPTSNVVDVLRDRINERWGNNDDKNKIQTSMIPIVVVGSKFDIFAKQYEPVKKK